MKVVFILWEGRSIDSRQCYGFKISIIKELLAAKAYGHSAEAWEVTRGIAAEPVVAWGSPKGTILMVPHAGAMCGSKVDLSIG